MYSSGKGCEVKVQNAHDFFSSAVFGKISPHFLPNLVNCQFPPISQFSPITRQLPSVEGEG